MIKASIDLYFKQWLRTGSIMKIIQLIIVLIFPVLLFTLIFVVPVIVHKDSSLSTATAGFFVFLISGAYAHIYKIESEGEINREFPMEYIPLSRFTITIIHILFTTLIVSIVIYISFFLSIFIIDLITKKVMDEGTFSVVFKILKPFFAGLVYIILSGVITGSFTGILGKKLTDNVSGGMKRFVTIAFNVLLFILLKPYFTGLWNRVSSGELSSAFYRFSPVSWSLVFTNTAAGNFDLPVFVTSILFVCFLIFVIVELSRLKFIGSSDISIPFKSVKAVDFKNLTPLWNILLSKWFTLPVIIFMLVWIGLVWAVNITGIEILHLPAAACFLIYTFIALFHLFPSKNEDYRKLFEGLPLSRKHVEGVFLGAYYILFILPMLALSYASWGHLLFRSMAGTDFPFTLSSIVLIAFPILALYAIVPILIKFHPYLWSSNSKGKKLRKRTVVIYYAVGYFFISSLSSFAGAYYGAPPMREIINSLFWNNGYIVGKTVLYSLTGFALLVHIRGIVLTVRSFFKRS
ncbi:MAG: hypothetical protein R6U31_02455 [bacterium]